MKDQVAQDVADQGDDAVIRRILVEVCEATHMGFAAVARVTETRWIACQVEDRIDFGLKPGEELKVRETICDEIREGGAAIIIDEVGIDPDWRTHPVPALYGFQSYASLPIFLGDGTFYGTLCAIDPNPRELSAPEMVDTLTEYARRVARILTEKMGDGAA